MPTLSLWTIRLACLHLIAGLSVGAIILANKGVLVWAAASGWIALHQHTLLFGWTVQLIFGVAYWILPTFRGGTNRGNDAFALAAVVLVNLGAVVGSFAPQLGGGAAATTAAYTLELASAACFAAHAWPRVKAFGTG